jgi:predicted metal-dependent HD superfamily phosphohydrolase
VNTALEPRWAFLCNQAGLDGRAEWREMSAAYGNPSRAYHNLDHIADCLLQFDEHSHLASDPVALEFAIWFHDIVYDARAADNEERSAAAAERFLSATIFGRSVGDLIRATKHHVAPGTPDAALLCDIDLSILGRSPGEYDAYARAIRQEYSWVPLAEYVKGRIRVLESFLGRPSIFALEDLEGSLGESARANLLREIGRLADAGCVTDLDLP